MATMLRRADLNVFAVDKAAFLFHTVSSLKDLAYYAEKISALFFMLILPVGY